MSRSLSLASRQEAFIAQVLDEDAPLPDAWDQRHAAGIEVYRGNYRSSLIDALRSTYEKTERWVGEENFQRAAAHHIISNPPNSWTIDDAGADFDKTCAELFRHDPEVAELAWLEWNMLQAFVAANVKPLDTQEFTEQTSQFCEDDWANLCLEFVPGAAAREVTHDQRTMWHALGKEEFDRPKALLDSPQSVLVWRAGERSTFMMGSAEEARAFAALQAGAAYGELSLLLAGEEPSDQQVQDAAMRAGAMLGRWLNEGLIAAIGH